MKTKKEENKDNKEAAHKKGSEDNIMVTLKRRV